MQETLGARTIAEQAMEQVLERIRGVTAARVVLDASGSVQEIHVVATPARGPKQIVRDVESALAAQFGVVVDHRRVSVAQLTGEWDAAPAEQRPMLHSILVETSRDRQEVVVRITRGDSLFEGAADGPPTGQLWRLTALAATRAMEEYLQGACRLILGGVVPFEVGGYQGFLVTVTMHLRRAAEMVAGAALVDADEAEAVAKAVLDAVNRTIARVAA